MAIKFPRRNASTPMRPAALSHMLSHEHPETGGRTEVLNALWELNNAYQRVNDAHVKNFADVTVSTAARTVRSAKIARTMLTPAIEALQKARASAGEVRHNLLNIIARPLAAPTNLADVMLATEIRAHYAALPSDKQISSLKQAMESGDAVTLRAIGAAPAYLTGLAPGLHAAARDTLVDMDPEARQCRAKLKDYEEQEALAAKVEQLVLQSTAELIDFVEADNVAAAAAAAVAAAG